MDNIYNGHELHKLKLHYMTPYSAFFFLTKDTHAAMIILRAYLTVHYEGATFSSGSC